MPRASKWDKLSPETRARITELLIEHGFSDYVWLTEHIEDELGVDVGGKSALQREGARLKRRIESVSASIEAAKAMNQAAKDDGNELGAAVISMVQADFMSILLELQDAEDEDDPEDRLKLRTKAAKAIAELARAGVAQKKWMLDVAAKAKAAADQVSKIAAKGGLSEEGQNEIRRRILGIAS
jgi:hypothetical protein